MAYDGLVLSAIAKELETRLVGGRIDKVQQPTADDVLLTVRADRTTHRLLLSANKSYPRVHLTTRFAAPNPPAPPMFCMLMRKHLEGGRIVRVAQWQRERILFIDIESRDEISDRVTRRIAVEVMGKHSNILLLDRPDGTIIDAVSHVSARMNRHREILPGRAYVYPPVQDKSDPFIETEAEFVAKRALDTSSSLGPFLVAHYLGVSPFFGKEVAWRLHATPDSHTRADATAAEWRAFHALLVAVQNDCAPSVVVDEQGRPLAFYLFPPQHMGGTFLSTESINDCVDLFYNEKAMTDIARSKVGSFLRLIRAERDKTALKIDKFERLLAAAEDAEGWRIAGELLTAYMHQVPRGATEIILPNFYADEQPTRIELNPAKSALDNANAHFKRYGKYKKGTQVTLEQLALAREELTYLESVVHELETCRIEDAPEIEAELRETGYLRRETLRKGGAARSKATSAKVMPAHFQASDGTAIWVGRNNKENDALTFRTAKKSDVWLHVKDAPGSHVIIATPTPTANVLYEAATLAAYFSRLRDSSKIAVDYVSVKNIWKPNNAKPGFVLFTGQQTLMVQIDQATLERLLATRDLS